MPRTRRTQDPVPTPTVTQPATAPIKNKGGRPRKTPVAVSVLPAVALPNKYAKVRKAIEARDITEVAWELLDTTLTDIEQTGSSPLGKSILMELVRTISVQKGNGELENRMQRVDELKTWLRKA